MIRAALMTTLLWSSLPAMAQQTVRVRVVDVAGGRAYVQPGADRGLRAGTRVRFGQRRFRVAAVNRTSAVIELGDRHLRVGNVGRARVRRRRTTNQADGLPDVTPLAAFRGQWPQPRRPALDQHPDPVPLGGNVNADDPLRLSALVGTLLRVPLGSEGRLLGRGFARVRLHAEPLHERPLSVDVDAQAQLWLGSDIASRPGDGSRPYLLVRRLELAYGRDASIALGRLRRASAFVGNLDGARVRTPTFGGGFSFGAFGGIVPNPTDGAPNLDVARFGAEAHFERPDNPLRPIATLVAHGSTYKGIDERRLAAELYIHPDWGSAGAFAELSMFRPNNRWNAPRVDLTTLGMDFGFRTGPFSAHLHGSLRKPERSRFIDSLLPPEWTCTPTPQSGAPTDEPCDGRYHARHYGSADVGVEVGERLDLRVGGTIAHTGTRNELDVGTGFVQVRAARIANLFRLSVMAEASGGSLLRRYGGRLEVGAGPILGKVDVTLHYGAAAGMLRADQKLYIEHRAGGSLYLSMNRSWRFRLMADALAGGPTSAMLIQAQLIWSL